MIFEQQVDINFLFERLVIRMDLKHQTMMAHQMDIYI